MLFVLVVKQASYNSHAAAGAYSELNGCIFIDNEGNVAIAAAHNWRLEEPSQSICRQSSIQVPGA